ncbi:MAG: bacillithiol system redox-active protein YtxJ [Bacteroidota bacterium]|nr:bacillithiol system redox-active protein YtxJ [Bacteroidota bacterium]
MNWIPLVSIEQLENIKKDSFNSPILIFKHSTRCSISEMSKNRLERSWTELLSHYPIFYLDLIQFREVSNQVSERFQVYHESPQLLIIHKGECIYSASHMEIRTNEIEEEILAIK